MICRRGLQLAVVVVLWLYLFFRPLRFGGHIFCTRVVAVRWSHAVRTANWPHFSLSGLTSFCGLNRYALCSSDPQS